MSNTTLYVDREEEREAWTRGRGQHYQWGLGIDCRKEFGQKVKESIYRGRRTWCSGACKLRGSEGRQFCRGSWGSCMLLPHGFDMLLRPPLISTLSCRHAAFVLDENIFQGRELINSRSLQALMAGLKAYSTWETISCLQDCRECTGGMVSPEAEQACGLHSHQTCRTLHGTACKGNKMCQAKQVFESEGKCHCPQTLGT